MQKVSKVRSCKQIEQASARKIDITLVFSPLGYGVIIGSNWNNKRQGYSMGQVIYVKGSLLRFDLWNEMIQLEGKINRCRTKSSLRSGKYF